jgi:hypothetical protein
MVKYLASFSSHAFTAAANSPVGQLSFLKCTTPVSSSTYVARAKLGYFSPAICSEPFQHQETSFCSRTGDCALGAPVGENLSNAFEPAHVESVSQAISVDEITRSLIDKLAKI